MRRGLAPGIPPKRSPAVGKCIKTVPDAAATQEEGLLHRRGRGNSFDRL